MNTPIKPCPRCGGVDIGLVQVDEVLVAVECYQCCFRPGARETDEEVIKLWNDEPDLSGKPIIFRDQVLAYLLGQVHTQNNLVEWYAKDPTILIRYKDESDAFIAEIYLKEE